MKQGHRSRSQLRIVRLLAAIGMVSLLATGCATPPTDLVTEFIETLVLMVLSFTDKMEGMRLADVAINSDYWYFVVISGFLVDFVIYGTTRFM
jgi:hypothetical protein